MEQVGYAVNKFDTTVSGIFETIERPDLVKALITLFLMLYAARIAPVPPKPVLDLFENVYFKIFIFTLILWTAHVSPSISILIAVAFMITINYTTKGKIWETLENVPPPNTVPTPVAPTPEIAVKAAQKVLEEQHKNTTTVETAIQNPNTIVITPTIVPTAEGHAVVNPTVVVSPAVISTPSGDKVVVTPSVQAISPAPAVPAPAVPAPAVPAPAVPAPAVPVPAVPAPAPVEKEEGCYPLRHVDMSKISGLEDGKWSFEDYAGWKQ